MQGSAPEPAFLIHPRSLSCQLNLQPLTDAAGNVTSSGPVAFSSRAWGGQRGVCCGVQRESVNCYHNRRWNEVPANVNRGTVDGIHP